MKHALALAVVIAILWPTTARAKSPVASVASAPARHGQRIWSRDGVMLLPVASNVLGADTWMHLKRGSESAFDVSLPQGSPVYGACIGKVIKASGDNAGGYGNNVIVHCTANGVMVWTGHHDKLFVNAGQAVNQQTIIGTVGMTGQTSYSHIHITLRRVVNGKWQRPTIERYWPMAQFHWSPWASPKGKAWAWSGAIASQPMGRTSHPLRTHAWWVLIVCLVLLVRSDVTAALVGLRGGQRGALVGGFGSGIAAIGVAVAVVILLVVPAPSTVAAQTTTGGFQQAHRFTKGWEGWKCTHDPVRTMGGVTQATYNGFLMRKGLQPADVCQRLTPQQAEHIYYTMYWVASGANRLAWPLAAAHYDTAVGSGVGRARGFLQQCMAGSVAQRFVCYQRQRLAFYQGMSSYSKPWVRRTNDLTQLVTH
ncbi:MAG: peptidoglycan DD-metalloendopeptidase family protein [Gammaproteobacteria bacterium]|nr:peptidoglycan DD-metalloendopeptidase family protein [Gammaproteobacteria bacterium]